MQGIYIITCNVNRKKYVGLSVDIERRLRQHFHSPSKNISNPYLREDIERFSVDNFSVEKIDCTGYHQAILQCFETNLIKKLGTLYPTGYNLTDNSTYALTKERGTSKERATSRTPRKKGRIVDNLPDFIKEEMKELRALGTLHESIGKRFNMTKNQVSAILRAMESLG